MKRSEMVEKIKELLKGYEDPGYEEEREDDADNFLSFIENLGMRPPILLNQKYKGPMEGWDLESDKNYQHSPKCPQLCINEKCEIKDET